MPPQCACIGVPPQCLHRHLPAVCTRHRLATGLNWCGLRPECSRSAPAVFALCPHVAPQRSPPPACVRYAFAPFHPQYRSAVFVHNDEQRRVAAKTLVALETSGVLGRTDNGRPKLVATQLLEAGDFWPAEDYHQDYYQKSLNYKFYRSLSGRDRYLQSTWGDEYGGHTASDVRAANAPKPVTEAVEAYLTAKTKLFSGGAL